MKKLHLIVVFLGAITFFSCKKEINEVLEGEWTINHNINATYDTTLYQKDVNTNQTVVKQTKSGKADTTLNGKAMFYYNGNWKYLYSNNKTKKYVYSKFQKIDNTHIRIGIAPDTATYKIETNEKKKQVWKFEKNEQKGDTFDPNGIIKIKTLKTITLTR